jgi:hypothetical protein
MTPGSRADQLSELLSEIDAAIRARFTDAQRRETKRWRRDATERRAGLRGVAAATLRWLAGKQV